MKDKETEEGERYSSSKEKRKQILGETMNSGSHKKDECVNENTIDVPKTRKVVIKRIISKCFYEVNKHETKLKGWLMPPTKSSSKKLKKKNYIPIMFCMQ